MRSVGGGDIGDASPLAGRAWRLMVNATQWRLPARPALRHSVTIKAANRRSGAKDVGGSGLMRTQVTAAEAEDAVTSNPAFNRTRREAASFPVKRRWRRAG